jgi:peptidoglycan/xylan/chitin deacetylase (PgdA/CDA1 family)
VSRTLGRFTPVGVRRIFTFHGIGAAPRALERDEELVWLPEERFGRLLDVLARQRTVELTFDDGNASDAEIALPKLRERGLRGTFFVVAGRLDQPGFLSREQLGELVAAGMEVGSHGMAHRPWRGLDRTTLAEELIESRAMLEDNLGRPVDLAACPFGAYDRGVLRAAKAAGYRRLFTSDGGSARPAAWLQPRTTLTIEDDESSAAALLERESPPRRVTLALKRTAKGLR